MCALKKAKKLSNELINQTVVHSCKVTAINNTATENVIEPYTNKKEELLYSHPWFKWLRNNIRLISKDALRCYITNLVPLGHVGKTYFLDIMKEREGSLMEYDLLYSNAEKMYENGTLRITPYDALYTLGYLGENFGGITPAEEILKISEEEYEKEIGLMRSPKGIHYINSNVFQRHFFSRVTIFKYNEEYYIYDLSGYYKKIESLQIKKLAKEIVHEGKKDIWNTKMEKEIWNAINLEIPIYSVINNYKKYINLNNGMYDIYTRKLEPHDPKFLSTVRVPVNYNIDAKSPLFKKFLYDLMQGDEERISLCEEIMGYCLTLLNCIQKGFFFYGTGGNGKSKLADIMSHLCGKSNVSNMSLEVLGTTFGTETLPNKLVNISPENEFNGKYMDTGNFKSITGGDTVYINAKHKTGKSCDIFAKAVSLLNKLPDTKDTSNGYFRRVLIVPFYNVFTGNSDDKEIVNKLLDELDGILNVALEGLSRLIDNKFNLTESKVSDEILNRYRLEQNPIEEYFKDRIICTKDASIRQSDILKQFKKWSEDNGYNDWSNISSTRFWNSFRKVLADKGVLLQNTKKIKGITYIVGITIK